MNPLIYPKRDNYIFLIENNLEFYTHLLELYELIEIYWGIQSDLILIILVELGCVVPETGCQLTLTLNSRILLSNQLRGESLGSLRTWQISGIVLIKVVEGRFNVGLWVETIKETSSMKGLVLLWVAQEW